MNTNLIHRPDPHSLKFFLFNFTIALFFALGFRILWAYFPIQYTHLTYEDGWIEFGTFVLLMLSAYFLTRIILKDATYRKAGYFLLLAGLVFIAMEEISWGTRLIHFKTPYFITKQNLLRVDATRL